MRITIEGNTATLKPRRGEAREFPIEWKEGHPYFTGVAPSLGVLIGKDGKKVWNTGSVIAKNSRWKDGTLGGSTEWRLTPHAPLSSINGDPCIIRDIVGFWDETPANLRSQR